MKVSQTQQEREETMNLIIQKIFPLVETDSATFMLLQLLYVAAARQVMSEVKQICEEREASQIPNPYGVN